VRELYQGDATSILHPSTGLRNHISQSPRNNLGRLRLQTGRNHARHGNRKLRARQIETKGFDSELPQAIPNELQHGAGIGGFDGQMLFTLRHRLQQRTSIRIDHGGAPPMTLVPLVERDLSALTAFRLDNREREFELTHFKDGGAGGSPERRPRS